MWSKSRQRPSWQDSSPPSRAVEEHRNTKSSLPSSAKSLSTVQLPLHPFGALRVGGASGWCISIFFKEASRDLCMAQHSDETAPNCKLKGRRGLHSTEADSVWLLKDMHARAWCSRATCDCGLSEKCLLTLLRKKSHPRMIVV